MSKPANRRVSNFRQRKKQQHLLDVKIRASTERKRLIGKIFSITFRLILFGALIAGAWIGGKEALRRFVFENPDYAIREVKFLTDGTLTREQVLKAGSLVEGQNIFLVNLGQARAAIEKMPQVEMVEVTRTLPNRLSVAVTERKPIAWVVSKADEDATVSEKAFLIDARGVLMKTKAKLEEYLHFPVISGVQTENLVAGERVTTSEMQAALELIRLTSESTRFQARHIDLSKGYCLVVIAHSHAKVTFGLERIDAQLARLQRYLAHAAEDQKEIQTVNLIVERNTPVTFVEAIPPDGDPADASKPADPKLKNIPPAPADKTKAAVAPPPGPPIPKAIAVATPIPAATSATRPTFFGSTKASPTPAKADAVKKPFRLH
ncbi:MAG TPA: FtsQ-type POTRA domain-containing protein [Chthoniobacteraceae bacterium]|nr:FtsQ-type POTRA domain-containing protein [Chthoniobacteraceae bacterium]